MTAPPGSGLPLTLRVLVVLAATVGSMALAWFALPRNIDRACEAAEWPNLSSCPVPPQDKAQQVQSLRERASRNPGDSTSYLALAVLATQPPGIQPLNEEAVFATAEQLAPHDPMLRRVLATNALAQEQWAPAVKWLVQLVEKDRDGVAAIRLAGLLTRAQSREIVLAEMKPGSQWVAPVLAAMPAATVPLQEALPFISAALTNGLISSDQGLALVSQLKAGRRWLEAQALWLRLLGQPTALVYNGDFEQGFLKGGFDWEPAGAPAWRSGVVLSQPAMEGAKGRVLALSFNHRPLMVPVIAQTLVLFPGPYRFSGRYMSRRLRAGAGLVWTAACTEGGVELARTPALLDTGGAWQELAMTLDVPEACGAVQLQLRTQVASDALAGLHGDAYFDEFRLRVPSTTGE